MRYVVLVALAEHAEGEYEGEWGDGWDGGDGGDEGDGLEYDVGEEDHIGEAGELQEQWFGEEGEEVVLGRVDLVVGMAWVLCGEADDARFVLDLSEKYAHQIKLKPAQRKSKIETGRAFMIYI